MTYAFIRNGIVENVADTAPPPGWSIPGMSVVQSNTAKVGDYWNGSTFGPRPVTSEMVNEERAARIERGMTATVNGKVIAVQGRDEDTRNLQGLAFAAQLRIAAGDNLTTTLFRDGNNVDWALVPGEMLDLWSQAAAYVSRMYQRSWTLKAANPIPQNYRDDAFWL